jgi:hypothetical protein
MPHIEEIHFVAGLGQMSAKPLDESQLLAIELAVKFHPRAEVFLHTSTIEGTCDNYDRASTRRVKWAPPAYSAWPTWYIDHGAHMSDKLRLDVLLASPARHQLYIDTDAYCLRNLDHLAHIEGAAMARLSAFSIANGLIYQGPDKSYLRQLHKLMGASRGESSNVSGSRLPQDLAYDIPGLTVLDSATYHGVSGDAAYHGYWNEAATIEDIACPKLADGACVAHVISSGTGQQWGKFAPGTKAAAFLDFVRRLAAGAADD